MEYRKVKLSDLKDSKYNVRENARENEEEFNELLQSVHETDGPMQAPVVNSSLEVIIGKRRVEACKVLGKEEIEVAVDPSLDDPIKAVAASYHENEMRKSLEPEEREKIIGLLESMGLNQRQVAGVLGVDESLISKTKLRNSLIVGRLLPTEAKKLPRDKRIALQRILEIMKMRGEVFSVLNIKELALSFQNMTNDQVGNLLRSVKAGGDIIFSEKRHQNIEKKNSKSIPQIRLESFNKDKLKTSYPKENIKPKKLPITKLVIYLPNKTFQKLVKRSNEVSIKPEELAVNIITCSFNK